MVRLCCVVLLLDTASSKTAAVALGGGGGAAGSRQAGPFGRPWQAVASAAAVLSCRKLSSMAMVKKSKTIL